jgi:hypothetical protein
MLDMFRTLGNPRIGRQWIVGTAHDRADSSKPAKSPEPVDRPAPRLMRAA